MAIKKKNYCNEPTLNSHTHCQAAPANAQTQAWQRVCLPNRTNKTTDKLVDEKEHRSDNTGFASGGVTCKLGALCFVSSVVLVDSFVLRNPPERKARKRYRAA